MIKKRKIESFGFYVVSHDFEWLWGGLLKIKKSRAQAFSNQFFKILDINSIKIGVELNPKVLIVKPNTRLILGIP